MTSLAVCFDFVMLCSLLLGTSVYIYIHNASVARNLSIYLSIYLAI